MSFNLGRGQSRDHLSLVNCHKNVILHKNKQLEAIILGKPKFRKKCPEHHSETRALIQVRATRHAWHVASSWLEPSHILQAPKKITPTPIAFVEHGIMAGEPRWLSQ